jgi:hypothetical protein
MAGFDDPDAGDQARTAQSGAPLEGAARDEQLEWARTTGAALMSELASVARGRGSTVSVIAGTTEHGKAKMREAVALELENHCQFWLDATGAFAIVPGYPSRTGSIHVFGERYPVEELILRAFPDLGLSPDRTVFDEIAAESQLAGAFRNRLEQK